MKEKITRDLNNYYQLGDAKTMATETEVKQTILQLMAIKYNQMCENKKVIQNNSEFLIMTRVLLQEQMKDAPIVNVQGFIKLQSFGETIIQICRNQNQEISINLMQLVS